MKKQEEPIAGRYRVTVRHRVEERGVDMRGNPVIVRPRAGSHDGVAFIEQEEIERVARVMASIESPWVLPVLCASPRVVYVAPPPATRPAPLAASDAAVCLLQLCDLLARLHAAGWAGIRTDVYNARVTRQDDGWRLTVVLPHLPVPVHGYVHAPWSRPVSVHEDLRAAAGFFRDLVLGHVAGERPSRRSLIDAISNKSPLLPPIGDVRAHAALTRLLLREASDDLPADAASLAEQVLPLVADRVGWAARLASLPRVKVVVRRPDYDRMIALGDAEQSSSAYPTNPHRRLALAAARHQRACVAYAGRDLASALRDLNKAVELDPWTRYLVTRGVVRDAIGDRPGARADYDRAVAQADRGERGTGETQARRDFERARALYARSVARLRVKEIAGACSDLAEALAMTLALRDPENARFERDAPWKKELPALESVIRRAMAVAMRAKDGDADAKE